MYGKVGRQQLTQKKTLKTGNWKTQGMAHKTAQIVTAVTKQRIHITVMFETKKGQGNEQIKDYIHVLS